MIRQVQEADAQIDKSASSDYVKRRANMAKALAEFALDRKSGDPPQPPGGEQSLPGPPPVSQPPKPPGGEQSLPGPPPVSQPPKQEPPSPVVSQLGKPDLQKVSDNELGYGDIKLLGRDASYDPADWRVVMEGMRKTPGSSNVYGYYFEFESRTRGTLYVTFKQKEAEGKSNGGPGPTYGYYDVPARHYQDFKRATDSSVGAAVWDYLRVRGTIWAHQFQYRLIQVQGDYVPRRATQRGYRTRHVVQPGDGPKIILRSTLPEELFSDPDRGTPERGQPDRGD